METTIIENRVCPICKIRTLKLIKNHKNTYLKTCGDKICIKNVIQQTNFKKYGHISNLHGSLKQNIINKLKTKYGVENVSQIESVKQKKMETCMKHFGVSHPMQSKVVMEKSKNTIMKMYGVDNVMKIPEIVDKIRKSWFVIDPLTGLSKYELTNAKRVETCIKKHNVPYYFQTEEFKKQYKKINLEKYGVDNYAKSDEYQKYMVDHGIKINPETRKEIDVYRNNVYKYTKRSFIKYKSALCSLYNRSLNYHLDHIYSIIDGFKNKIDPRIIGSIPNLQIIPSTINIKKQGESWMTVQNLIESYNKLSDEDKFIV